MKASSPNPYPTTVSDDRVRVGLANITAVKTDNMKRQITITIVLPLNGDNFMAANKLAFFAFEENPVGLDIEAIQQSFTGMATPDPVACDKAESDVGGGF